MYFAGQKKDSLFTRLGGEAGVRAQVETLYDIIEQDAAARPLHELHLQGAGVAKLGIGETWAACANAELLMPAMSNAASADLKRMK